MRIDSLFYLVRLAGLVFFWQLTALSGSGVAEASQPKSQVIAKRIISLAPFITELLYAIEAGDRIVGTVEYSDFPPEAKKLPRIGRYNAVDEEKIISLKPDLVLAWKTGTPSTITDRLARLGIPVFFLEPSTLEDVRSSLMTLGDITGQKKASQAAAYRFGKKLAHLRSRYANQKPVSVFYQIWDKPLMSVGGRQIVSDVMRVCGGKNIFASISKMAFPVSLEAVIQANPQVIMIASSRDDASLWRTQWKPWTQIDAVRKGAIFAINPDLMRHTPRILDGVKQMCDKLDQARRKF